jgi:hypothetical protein
MSREFRVAADCPATWWPDDPDDPRDSCAWLSSIRWAGDGISFVGASELGPFAVTQRDDGAGYARMSPVAVCAGAPWQVDQPPAIVAEAQARRYGSWLVAHGYRTPIRGGAHGLTRSGVETLLARVSEGTAGERGVPILHVEPDSELMALLPELGYDVGVTDLSARLPVMESNLDAYVERQPPHRRRRMARELRRFRELGGQLRVVRGADAMSRLGRIGELEACASRARGGSMTAAMSREVNARLFESFGEHAYAVLVVDSGGDEVASTVVVCGRRAVLARTAGFTAAARDIGGYFHAAMYGPLAVAQERGADDVLLGPLSLRPKLLRGAYVTPLYSAVPTSDAVLSRLLSTTDRAVRRIADQLRAEFGDDAVRDRAGEPCRG